MMVGKLLVAHPSILGDQSFSRSIVIVAEHNEGGSLGFIINKPTHYTLNDLLPEMGFDAPIFQGGPVDQDRLFYIHTKKDIPQAEPLGSGLYWGGVLENIKQAIHSKELLLSQIKFILGYAGWEKGQLSRETREKSWVIVKNTYPVLQSGEDLWGTILRNLGGELAYYAAAPSHPGLN